MNKIRIGHIGTAHDHSGAVLACIRKFPDIFDFVGLVDTDREKRSRYKIDPYFAGISLMTEDELFKSGVDCVNIEGFELDLISIARHCAQRGVHMHIDKPMGANLSEFEALLALAKSKNLVIQTGYMYRYNTAVRYALDLKNEGKLGEINTVDAIMNCWHNVEKRQWLNNLPCGMMFFLGCHMVDLVYLFMGKPNRVIPYNKQTNFDGVKATDHGFAVFEYPNGISTVRSTDTEVNGFARRQLTVCGSKGTVEIHPLELFGDSDGGRIYFSDINDIEGTKWNEFKREIPLTKPAVFSRYDAMMLDFAAFVRGEKKNPYDYDYEYEVQKLVLQACGIEC